MKFRFYIFTLFLISLCVPSLAQDDEKDKPLKEDNEKPEEMLVSEYDITKIKVKDSIFLLRGKGGNVGMHVGKDGVLVIDSQFEASAPKIMNTILQTTQKPVKFLINTHHHGDHTGGNAYINSLGITTIAQERVWQRLFQKENEAFIEAQEKAYEAYLKEAKENGIPDEKAELGGKRIVGDMEKNQPESPLLPSLTFQENMTFYFNNDKILVFHVHNAHTDGDVMVFFTKNNVIHTGDAFIEGGYPFIDLENGGSLEGYLKGLSKIMMMIDEDTKIIPGHGAIASKKDVEYTYKMLDYLKNSISYHRINKKTEDEVAAMKDITKDFDAKGFGKGFISSEKIVRTIYQEVAKKYPWKK